VHELVHAARFFRRNVLRDIEVAYGSAEAGWESGDIEARHRSDAALSPQNGIPCRLDGAPDRGHHSKTRYDDPPLAHALPAET
jgi:hypothetical protein